MKSPEEWAYGLLDGECSHPRSMYAEIYGSSLDCIKCVAAAIRAAVLEALDEVEHDAQNHVRINKDAYRSAIAIVRQRVATKS